MQRPAQRPIAGGLLAYAQRVYPWHTPGHKGGRFAHPSWLRQIGPEALRMDQGDEIEAPDGSGRLSQAAAQAESLAARVFGAAFTRFLVQGSTSGVHVALAASWPPGGRLVLPRHSHTSWVGAAVWTGAEPVFLPAEFDRTGRLPLPPGAAAYAEALDRLEGAPAVCAVTHPNALGIASDAAAIAEAAARRGALLIADEAYGAHFAFHPAFPRPALQVGAELTVQSAHKTLGALTQASWLHGRLPHWEPAVDRALALLQTTSPSPLLLASLEAAVFHADRPQESWERTLELAEKARGLIEKAGPFRCLRPADFPERPLDGARLLIDVEPSGWSGPQAAAFLRENGHQVELAAPAHLSCIATPGDDEEAFQRLAAAFGRLAKSRPQRRQAWPAGEPPPGPRRMLPREAALGPVRLLPLSKAAGCIAAEPLCPYPPGVPVVWPGEEITGEAVEHLQQLLSLGASMWGKRDGADWEVAVALA